LIFRGTGPGSDSASAAIRETACRRSVPHHGNFPIFNDLMNRILLLALIAVCYSIPVCAKDTVILLHGLLRDSRSMEKMSASLVDAGYEVTNVDYPSHSASVEELSETILGATLARLDNKDSAAKIHFVTHSLGGILVRQYLSRHQVPQLGRVVMLAPPNQGSEVVDKLGDLKAFEWINGPSGKELGTSPESVPNKLGPVHFELGVIAGDRSINGINSRMIPGPDDGKVSVERTKVQGMKEHITLHATHPYIMKNREAIGQTVFFLGNGTFQHR